MEVGADDPGKCRCCPNQERLLFGTESSKWKSEENVGLLLNGTGDTVTKDTERTLLETFLTSVYTGGWGIQ